jgi:hypothetical protein
LRQPVEVIRDRLAVYLGPHTARNAVKTFFGGSEADTLDAVRAASMLGALRPMLKTLVGSSQCERILSQLTLELGLRS